MCSTSALYLGTRNKDKSLMLPFFSRSLLNSRSKNNVLDVDIACGADVHNDQMFRTDIDTSNDNASHWSSHVSL